MQRLPQILFIGGIADQDPFMVETGTQAQARSRVGRVQLIVVEFKGQPLLMQGETQGLAPLLPVYRARHHEEAHDASSRNSGRCSGRGW